MKERHFKAVLLLLAILTWAPSLAGCVGPALELVVLNRTNEEQDVSVLVFRRTTTEILPVLNQTFHLKADPSATAKQQIGIEAALYHVEIRLSSNDTFYQDDADWEPSDGVVYFTFAMRDEMIDSYLARP